MNGSPSFLARSVKQIRQRRKRRVDGKSHLIVGNLTRGHSNLDKSGRSMLRSYRNRWRQLFLAGGQISNGSSVAMDEDKRLSEFLKLQVVLTISPYPESMREEFTVDTRCISDDYEVEFEPTVIGQYVRHGKVALTLLVRITPKKPR